MPISFFLHDSDNNKKTQHNLYMHFFTKRNNIGYILAKEKKVNYIKLPRL